MADIMIAASANTPTIAAFRNIQFVAAFTDGTSSTINAVTLSTGGAAAGNQFRVNVPTDVNPTRMLPAIVECAAGFVIAWIEHGPDLVANVKLRIFDADTLSPGNEIQVNTTPVDLNQPPALARLTDGGFVVVWADVSPDARIRAQRFDALGNRNGPDFRANSVAGLHRRPIVAVLSNGSIVIGWLARGTGPLQVRFQIFDATAAPVGGERAVGGATMAAVTALDSGRFVIAHVRSPADGEILDKTIVMVDVFEPTGAASGNTTAVTDEQAILSDWPRLAPLPGGRFLVTWTQGGTAPAPALPDVEARIFSDTQGPLGQISQLNTTTGGLRFSLCAATALGTGAGAVVLAAWASSDVNLSGIGVFGTAIPAPATGGF